MSHTQPRPPGVTTTRRSLDMWKEEFGTKHVQTAFGRSSPLEASVGCETSQVSQCVPPCPVPRHDPWDWNRTAAPERPPQTTTPGLIGSPMAVPWSVWGLHLELTELSGTRFAPYMGGRLGLLFWPSDRWRGLLVRSAERCVTS